MELIEYTTIQIRKETRERLKTLRITRRESYDEIITRLINFYEGERKKREINHDGP